jgi:large subunit ribosomal protein L25
MAAKSISLPKGTYELAVEKRSLFGRKVKKLRKEGILPANIYGKDFKSVSVQLPLDEFKKALSAVGETGIVGLKLNGQTIPALIHHVQFDPTNEQPLHADFLKVNFAEKVTATVPIEFVGESPAEKSGEGVVVRQMNEVEVEALPTDLPDKIAVDISSLATVNSSIKVEDLPIDRSKIEIKANPEQIVVNVAPPTKEEAPSPPEAAPAEGEVGETKEEEKPQEGNQPEQEANQESK